MILVERDRPLEVLNDLLAEAGEGHGRVALVRGEAGIGKTSLIRYFVEQLDGVHILWGGCDDLMAARPLGPFWDMAFDEADLQQSLESGDRQQTFVTALELVSRALRPTAMIVEDVHWADDATLDLIKFVGRRMDRTHGLLVLTYRDGEVPGDHPLRVSLGELPAVVRIPLEPLTEDGVRSMAVEDVDSRALWKVTGGNPFFVTEVLASGVREVPLSIRDAVNARVQRLSEEARAVVELTSVTPSRVELVVVKDILGDVGDAIAECEKAGILELTGDSLGFKHELARRAVERELPVITRRSLNLASLGACERLGFDLSICAHHAREAEDPMSIVRILPEAARRAAQMWSNAQAVITLRALEPHIDRMTLGEQADHYDLWAYEESLTSKRGRLDIVERAIAIRRQLDDPAGLSNSLLLASRLSWVGSDRSLAIRYAEEAAKVADVIGGEDLAMAYSVLSQLAMLGGFRDETMRWAEKALTLAGETPSRVRAHALNNIGTVRMSLDPSDGRDELIESRDISAELHFMEDEARAANNLAGVYLTHFMLDEAEVWIDELMRIVEDAEMEAWQLHTYALKAGWYEMRGEWVEAEANASAIPEEEPALKVARVSGVTVLAKIAARRGSPQARRLIDEAITRAKDFEEAQSLGPAYAVLAEYAWLGGEVGAEETDRAVEVMEWCCEHANRQSAGEIGQWLNLMGVIGELPDSTPEPYRRLSAGDWEEAAAWWAGHGLPYERAVALSHGGTEAQLSAVGILDGLGAVPLASRIRTRLRSAAVKGVPRGPQKTTRDNPLGLTARQTEVLELLVEDLTNAEIADHLFISTKTVEHHVSAILTKLGATNRSEAAKKAREGS